MSKGVVPSSNRWNYGVEIYVQAIRREIIAQCQMSHPNVLQILGVCGGEHHEMSIVSPWMDGTAMEYLEQHQNREDFLRIVSK